MRGFVGALVGVTSESVDYCVSAHECFYCSLLIPLLLSYVFGLSVADLPA